MAIKAAMWVHGTVVEAEYPNSLQSWVRKGWGTHFVGMAGTDNWFHIPITMPVILEDKQLKLARVFVFYNTLHSPRSVAGGAVVTDVHVYDGLNKVKEFNSLPNLAGKNDTAVVDSVNSWSVNPPIAIHFGLGLSVHVRFGAPLPPLSTVTHEIVFATAGADFDL